MLGLDWEEEEEEEETTPLVRLQSPDTICAGLPVCVSVRTNRPSPAALSEEVKGKHLSSVYLFAKWGGIISPTFRFFFLLLLHLRKQGGTRAYCCFFPGLLKTRVAALLEGIKKGSERGGGGRGGSYCSRGVGWSD